MGVNIDRVVMLTFLLGGIMAGGAGLLYLVTLERTTFNVGFFIGIKAFTAAVLGGIGNLRGALVGGLLLGLIENYGSAIFGTAVARPDRLRRARPRAAVPADRPPRRAARAGEGLMGIRRPASARAARGRWSVVVGWCATRWRAAASVAGRWLVVSAAARRCCRTSPTCPCSRIFDTPGSDFASVLFYPVGCYVLVAIGLNIVVGQAGLLDLGYVAFFAIGAYTIGVLGTSPRLDRPGCDPADRRSRCAMIAGVLLGAAHAATARRLPGHRHARLRRDHPHHGQQHRLARRPARHRRTSRNRRSMVSALHFGVLDAKPYYWLVLAG